MNNKLIPVNEITVCMIVFNEEKFLPYSLPPLNEIFDKFVVVDMGSQDKTLEIIDTILQDKVTILHHSRRRLLEHGYAHARNYAAKFATTRWILAVDADEVLTSGIDHRGVPIDRYLSDVSIVTVERRNITRPENDTTIDDLRFDQAPLSSTETHRRLYKAQADVKWAGYIHETLYVEPRSATDAQLCDSATVFYHLSDFKDLTNIEQKREQYFWMLLRAFKNIEFRDGTNAYWYDTFVPENLKIVEEGASSFADRRPVAGYSYELEAPSYPQHREEQASIEEQHDRTFDTSGDEVHELKCARRVHLIATNRWTGTNSKAFWFEWNHALEQSRSLTSIMDQTILMNWQRFIQPGSICIDIGAHSGDSSIPLGLFSFDRINQSKGRVISIEPNPDILPVLEINLSFNSHIAHFDLVRAAITREDVPAITLHDHGNANCNGGILDTEFSAKLKERLETASSREYTVQGISLKTLVKSMNLEKIDFIKIDFEGYDKEIIKSSKELLEKYKPVLFVEWFSWFSKEDDDDFFRSIEESSYISLNPLTLEPINRDDRIGDVLCIHRSFR
jgi:FkbM family methyltransferase